MKKLFNVLLNLISFGIPLFIQMLSKARKFNKLVNDRLVVTLTIDKFSNKKLIKISDNEILLLSLEVDIDHTSQMIIGKER